MGGGEGWGGGSFVVVIYKISCNFGYIWMFVPFWLKIAQPEKKNGIGLIWVRGNNQMVQKPYKTIWDGLWYYCFGVCEQEYSRKGQNL